MRGLARFLVVAVLASLCAAETFPFSTDLAAGAKLRLHVRSGDVRIVGADEGKLAVSVSGRNASRARHIGVSLRKRGDVTDVRIRGGPRNGITFTIRIPRETDLFVRVPFGDVRVENVRGNKDIELRAGDLTVDVGDPADYRHVDASVIAGDLSGSPFGEDHGGLFRSFDKTGNGPYRLHAHVGAGDLTLR